MFGSDYEFIGVELLLNEQYERVKVRFIKDQAQNDCLVDINRRKLIAVSLIYDLS